MVSWVHTRSGNSVGYFVDVRGWQTAEAAILFTVFMAGFTLSSFLAGFLGDRFDKRFGPKGRIGSC